MEGVQMRDSNKHTSTGNCTMKQVTAKSFASYGLCKK